MSQRVPGGARIDAVRGRTDSVIGELAARQHGVVGRSHLLEAGVPEHRIDYRLQCGSLTQLHHLGADEVMTRDGLPMTTPARTLLDLAGVSDSRDLEHAAPYAFERDHDRDGVLMAAGFRTLRVTWRQITKKPRSLIVRLAQALVR